MKLKLLLWLAKLLDRLANKARDKAKKEASKRAPHPLLDWGDRR